MWKVPHILHSQSPLEMRVSFRGVKLGMFGLMRSSTVTAAMALMLVEAVLLGRRVGGEKGPHITDVVCNLYRCGLSVPTYPLSAYWQWRGSHTFYHFAAENWETLISIVISLFSHQGSQPEHTKIYPPWSNVAESSSLPGVHCIKCTLQITCPALASVTDHISFL